MELDQLRERLTQIDQELLSLVAERDQLSQRIAEVKRREGRATRDFAREKTVLEGARQRARELGVSPGLAERLVRELIEASLTSQEAYRLTREGRGGGRRALVIGGAGKMGRWFAEFLGSQAFDVEIADPTGEVPGYPWRADWRELTLDHDVVVIATPMQVANEVLLAMAQSPPPGLVLDIGSLKAPLREGLQRAASAGVRVASIHPMFGPDAQLLSGRHVIFVDTGVAEATRAARELFDSTMARQVEMSLDDHDRLIAFVLGLSHALNIVFIAALAESHENVPRLQEMSSSTFDAQLGVSARVAQDNPHMYFEIQSLNDYNEQALAALEGALGRLTCAVRGGDEGDFVAMMRQGRDYFSALERP
ncbi:MAG: prephenate dehydrogenase/arogenate dehydrogenase family protein [Pseudomonadota bacterium]